VAFELNHDPRNISDDDLLTDLRRVAAEQSVGTLRQRLYKDLGKYGVTTVIRRFGSWNRAIDQAGLKTTIERNVPDQKLFAALYELWVRLGRQPSYSEVSSPACAFHVTTYERRFGSWRQALEAFVSYANSEEIIAPASVSERGHVTPRRMQRSPDLRLRFKVLQRDHFRCRACGGSPSVALGLSLQVDHVTPWSKGGETVIENKSLFDARQDGAPIRRFCPNGSAVVSLRSDRHSGVSAGSAPSQIP